MVCTLHCTQPKNLFREPKQCLVTGPFTLQNFCVWMSNLDEVVQDHWTGSSYICSVPLVENISGWKLNWRKGRMGSWAEHRSKTQSIPETSGNDVASMASIKSCYKLTVWIWACPINTACFITQPPYKANSTSQRCCEALVTGICKALGTLSLGQLENCKY